MDVEGGVWMAAGIVIAIVVTISTLWGLKQGLLRTVWSVASIIAAIVLAMVLNPYISDFMNEQIHLSHYIEKSVEEYLENETAIKSFESMDLAEQKGFVNELNIPESWKKSIVKNNTAEAYRKLLVNSFTEYVAISVARLSVRVICFILTFLLVWAAIQAISVVLHIVEHFPVIKQVNKLLGIGAGFLRGVLIIWIFMIAAAFLRNYGWGNAMVNWIVADPVGLLFYRYNFLFLFLVSYL